MKVFMYPNELRKAKAFGLADIARRCGWTEVWLQPLKVEKAATLVWKHGDP